MSAAFSCAAIEAIVGSVSRRTGLAFPANRRAEVEAGVRRAMAHARLAEPGEYLARLDAGDVPLDELVAELTIGESHFFRHPAHFEWLRDLIFPDLLARRGARHVIKVWSAGCASGEEAYSVAMTAERSGLCEQVEIIGTDVSPRMVARARHGRYRPWSLRGVDDAARARGFAASDDHWQVDRRFRSRVRFEVGNLAEASAAPGETDVILCRNVLIYLDPGTIRRVVGGLLTALSDGGWLILGPSDPPLAHDAPVETLVTPAGVLYRKRGRHRDEAPRRIVVAPADRPRGDDAIAASSPPGNDACGAGEAATAAVARVRRQARVEGAATALRSALQTTRRHPLVPEVHVLHASLLVELGRDAEAIAALRRVLYLDRSLAAVELLLGTVLQRTGDLRGARRAYRHARDRAAAMPPALEVPFGDGICAGRLVVTTHERLAALEGPEPGAP